MKMKVMKYTLLASLAGHGLHLPNEKHIETHASTRKGRKEHGVQSVTGPDRCLNALQEGLSYAMNLCRCHRCG